MANGTDTPDIPELLRRRNILAGMDLGQQDQQDQTTTTGIPWSQIPGSTTYQPPVDFSRVAGSQTYQPQDQPTQPTSLPPMDPRFAPKPIDLSTAQTTPPSSTGFEAAATNLQNVGQAPQRWNYPRNKLLTALVAPLMLKQFIRNPQQASEALDFMTRKGYGRAEQEYAQKLGQAEQDYKIQNEVLNERLKIFGENMRVGETQMALGRYNEWVHQLPLEQQERALKVAADQAEAIKRNAPTYSKTLEAIRIRNADGTTSVREGYLKTFPDGRTPEYVIPGMKSTVRMQDAIAVSKPASSSTNPLIQQIEDKRQEIRDRLGREPSPEEDDNIIGSVRLLAQKGISERQSLQRAQTLIGKRLQDDFIKPLDKKALDLRSVKMTLRSALGETDPEKRKNAVAAALAPLEEVRSVVGSGRVSVSEYPLIKDAPGKPQSFVAHIKNLVGAGAPVPQATLNDLDKFVDTMATDTESIRDIASRWSYKNLDATTEAEAKAAGEGFDRELKAFQNPPKPLTVQQQLDKVNEEIRKKEEQRKQ